MLVLNVSYIEFLKLRYYMVLKMVLFSKFLEIFVSSPSVEEYPKANKILLLFFHG